jgi:2-dehydro-3-deoxyphosphogluconate aldolase/(4S)-4-hydroxy-2-oxoglutarate aldolase
MSTDSIYSELEQIGIVPVISLEDTSKAVALAEALRKGGINAAEVTFRADGADKVIRAVSERFPDMLVGAGTVLSAAQADKAKKAGAKFLVAPGLNPKVVKHSLNLGIPFAPGVSSGSEIEQAMELGLSYVKFFPAEQAGGLSYIKAVSAPYKQMRFMPTGGINESNLADYLAFPQVFACGGSWMVAPELVRNEKWDQITALSAAAVDKMLGFGLAHIGINCADEDAAGSVADAFCSAFGFSKKPGAASIFAGTGIEALKTKFLGERGHIAIKTNSVLRAVYALKRRGFETDPETLRYDSSGRAASVYLKGEFGGFAVHLLQNVSGKTV